MSVDLILDSNTHDINFGSPYVGTHKDPAEGLSQRLKIAYLLRRTEWPLDLNKGVPYQLEFFKNKNNKSFVDSFMFNYALTVEDVDRVTRFRSSLGNDRKLTINISVSRSDGEQQEITLGGN